MKSLLHKHFTRTAEHHIAKSKHHAAIAKHASGLQEMHKAAKSEGFDTDALAELLQNYIDEHAAVGDEHASMAEHCLSCAKVCASSGKAMGDEIMPVSISGVAPENPAQKLTAIPRFGSPPLQKAAAVDPVFAALARVSDEESGD